MKIRFTSIKLRSRSIDQSRTYTSQNKFLREHEDPITVEIRGRIPRPDFYYGLTATFKTNAFYRRASRNFDDFKVTIVTQTTVDRLYKVAMMTDRWRGPVSTAVYIKNPEKDLERLQTIIDINPSLMEYSDFHLFFANNTRYPVNNLRNLAIKNARTDYVFIMDADFIPPAGLHDYLVSYIEHPDYSKPDEKHAFIVPSFSSSEDPNSIPDDKETFVEMVSKQLIKPSNLDVCPKCHTPTNFTRWMTSDEPYFAEYRWVYEPYLVYNKSKNELFEERLKGYGFDKNSHTWTMAVQGYRFTVLPRAYIVHINHPESSWYGPSLDEQLWDALRIVCDMFPSIKRKYGFDPEVRLFDEPLKAECLSNSHW
eukprot:gene6742-8359_t